MSQNIPEYPRLSQNVFECLFVFLNVPILVSSFLFKSHGLKVWKYPLQSDEYSMAVLRASLRLTDSILSMYAAILPFKPAKKAVSPSSSGPSYLGTLPAKADEVNLRARLEKLPRLARSSLLFLATKSYHMKTVSWFSGRLERRK